MKYLLMIFMAINIGCSHLAISSFDRAQGVVTIQGGKWDTEDDYKNKADKYCGRSSTLVAMGQKDIGYNTQFQSGRATSIGINRYLYTYSCN